MREIAPPARVVVGIDGSRAAIDAALWAVREAVDRNVPLRLVAAIEPKCSTPGDGQTYLQDFGTAECAILQAVTAVESTCEPVKIEAEIVRCTAAQALLNASPSAVMICIGADGFHADAGLHRGGSTATAVSAQAHCPVAIIRGSPRHGSGDPRWIVTCADGDSGDEFVVARAVEEARLRSAPLRVMRGRGPHSHVDVHDARHAAAIHPAGDILERSIARWRTKNPEIVIETEELTSGLVDYVVRQAGDIQLVVVGHEKRRDVAYANQTPERATLGGTQCSVLIAEPHRPL